MANGLGNEVVYFFIKKGNIFYIGTQDGFTIYNLLNRTSKKISINKGPVNEANIILADDEDKIIVGTLNGLAFYDIKTGRITNFKEELADNLESYSVNRILVTDKAIYEAVANWIFRLLVIIFMLLIFLEIYMFTKINLRVSGKNSILFLTILKKKNLNH